MEADNLDDIAPRFIDKYISTHVPSSEENHGLRKKVMALQTHKHTHTCERLTKEGTSCRFDFPQPVSPTTVMKYLPVQNVILLKETKEMNL